jgi:hypothetical protein
VREGLEQGQGEVQGGRDSACGSFYDTYSEAANTISLLMHCDTASIFLHWSKINE